MKTIQVSTATNIQLDWLVWTLVGGAAAYPKTASGKTFSKLWHGSSAKYLHPSTDWAQGGPIIEREGIETTPNGGYKHGRLVAESWCARILWSGDDGRWSIGLTPLVAAARCFVVSKLGKTVEVPEELT